MKWTRADGHRWCYTKPSVWAAELPRMGPRPVEGTFFATQASVDVTAIQHGPGMHRDVCEQP